MAVTNLTKSNIDKIPFSEGKQIVYCDEKMTGFILVVGKKSKTYSVRGWVNGERIQYKLGKHGILTPDEARQEARQKLADMARGVNPFEKDETDYVQQITVGQALEDYINDRKDLKPVSANGYRKSIELYVPDWRNKPLASITKTDILERHRKLGETKGESSANKVMRVMRQLFNYVHAKHGGLPDNPCRYLSLLKGWYKEERRKTLVKPHELTVWYQAVLQIVNPHIRDYLRLVLFTGLRKSEALGLRWEDVDFEERTFTVRETKNGEDHTLPMSQWLYAFFQQRRSICGVSPYVFPGHGRKGTLTTPRKSIGFVTKLTGIEFSSHDLRRSFITIAESLDISAYALKALVNHKSGSDVTSGYIVFDIERLRDPMERISQRIETLIMAEDKNQGKIDGINPPAKTGQSTD